MRRPFVYAFMVSSFICTTGWVITMFDFEENTEPLNEAVTADIQEYIRTVFTGAKELQKEADDYAAHNRLEGKNIHNHRMMEEGVSRWVTGKLYGSPEMHIRTAHLAAIRSQQSELSERLAQLQGIKSGLQTEMGGIQAELSLPRPSYPELLAQGDIAAADSWEAEKAELQGRLKSIQEKVAGFSGAGELLDKDIAIYGRMRVQVEKCLLLQAYVTKKQALDGLFVTFREAYLECDAVARELGLKREHYVQLLELSDVQRDIDSAFLRGAFRGGSNAEINLAARIRDGKKPFANWEAANIAATTPAGQRMAADLDPTLS